MVVRVAQGSDWFENFKEEFIVIKFSEWWVKVGGKQSPLSAWVLRNCGKKFQSDGSGAQTYRHCG